MMHRLVSVAVMVELAAAAHFGGHENGKTQREKLVLLRLRRDGNCIKNNGDDCDE